MGATPTGPSEKAEGEPPSQRAQIRQALFAQRERDHGDAHALRRCNDRRLGRGEQGDAVAAIEKAARFREDADFLTAPATGVLGMDDRQRTHAL